MSDAGLGALCRRIAADRSRRLVVLAGDREEALALLLPSLCRQAGRSLVLTDRLLTGIESLPAARIFERLGSEVDWLVFDAFAGLYPDAFGAAAGMVVGGGLLFLLAPPLECWAEFDDPDYQRLLPAGTGAVTHRFLVRLARLLCTDEQVIVVDPAQVGPQGLFDGALPVRPQSAVTVSQAQLNAVAAVRHVATGHRRRPLVLSGNRGCGKSAALGMAAAALLAAEPDGRVVVTAPRRKAVETLFRFACDSLIAAGVVAALDRLAFHPPDEVIRQQPPARLLLVDEAAAIPVPLLRQMLRDYSRVVFSTTVHGYEGSGRGFALRFQRELEALAPQSRQWWLETPVRWAAGDPLEAFVFRALLLDAGDVELPVVAAAPGNCHFRWIQRQALVVDEPLLYAIYGLLVIAHYRTTPDDLRVLLDGPNIRLLGGFCDGILVAVAMVALEGELPPGLAVGVVAGRRRVRGHLAAQLLGYRYGDPALVQLPLWRIIRIAVHPTVTNRGIGSALLTWLHTETAASLVSSFGATAELLRFWQSNGYVVLHLGSQRDAASGAHAVLVGRASDRHAAQLSEIAAVAAADIPLLLGDTLADLEPEVVIALADSGGNTGIDEIDRDLLGRFAAGEVDYESAAAALWRLAAGSSLAVLEPDVASALVLRVLQRHSWEHCAAALGLAGRKPLLAILRLATTALLG